jgi:tetratricopeptide (TPR) repeat protein
VESSLELAHRVDDPMILGRVQRARIQHHLWTGRIPEAREAADAALALSQASNDRGVEFWSRWAMGAMEGLLGNTVQMATHIAEAQTIAEDIGSPFLEAATRELQVELAYARGQWDEGLRVGEEAIDLARATDQRLVLPRLLVWVSMILVARGEIDRADRLTSEAWTVSGAARAGGTEGFIDLHSVVPAHIGRAVVALARGAWDEAIAIAEAGLALADRSGYVVWSMHHVLPIIAEAAIHSRQLDRAATVGARMRSEAERVGHPLAFAWAEVCDGILTWLQNDATMGVDSLRSAAEALEKIPMVYDAARVRRQLAGRLAELGDRDGALTELRHVHAIFRRLGAAPELAKTLVQFEELGIEPL